LFVKNLSYNTTEDSLSEFFEKYGTVKNVKILKNRDDGRSKGLGFVEFESNEEAKAALDNNNLHLDGRYWLLLLTKFINRDLQVNYSGGKGGDRGRNQGGDNAGDKHTAFVGNLSFKSTEDSIKKYFQGCGSILEVRIAKDRDTGKMKGFAHIDFEDSDGLQNAIQLNGAEFEGRELKVDASQPKSGGSGGRGRGFNGRRGGGDRHGGFGGRGGGRGGRGGGGRGGRGNRY